jgi:hypothetical protein
VRGNSKSHGSSSGPVRRRSVRELLFGVVAVVLIAVGLGLGAAGISSTLDGVVAGVGAGFLVTIGLVYAQRPSIIVVNAGDRYDGKSGIKWVHLAVQNLSTGFLGTGNVDECQATLIFDEGNRTFHPKWAGRPNPVRTQVVASPTGFQQILVADEHLFDQAKVENLAPSDPPKLLDVAFKFRGNAICYISEPEHFKGAGPTVLMESRPERAFEVGTHAFTGELRNHGELLTSRRFYLVNDAGTEPDSLRIDDAR